jgi:hypothetical protein
MALAELVCRLNPYTEQMDSTTGFQTGEMEIVMLPFISPPSDPPSVDDIINSVAIEVDANYGKWTFEGQSLTVKSACRIPYRFKVTKTNGGDTSATSKPKPYYYQTEYLVIGFAGAEGGG